MRFCLRKYASDYTGGQWVNWLTRCSCMTLQSFTFLLLNHVCNVYCVNVYIDKKYIGLFEIWHIYILENVNTHIIITETQFTIHTSVHVRNFIGVLYIRHYFVGIYNHSAPEPESFLCYKVHGTIYILAFISLSFINLATINNPNYSRDSSSPYLYTL